MTESQRVASIETAVHDLSSQVVSLEKQMSKLSNDLSRDSDDRKSFEATLRNVDNSLNSLILKFTALPMERHSDIQKFVDPIWIQVRKHETKFGECGDEVKADMRKEAKSHIGVVWLAVILVATMGLYIFNNAESDIIEDIRENRSLIKQHMKNVGTAP